MANQPTTNPDEHRKYYNDKGQEVPSCTTVLKLLAKNLEGWSNWLGRRGIDYDQYMKETASVGTEAHALAESIIKKDDSHIVNYNIISREDEGFLREKITFMLDDLKSKGYNEFTSELAIDGSRYGGTLDLLCHNTNTDEYMLLDFKTSKKAYDSMYIQLAGYCQLLEEVKDIHVSRVGIVLLRKDFLDRDFYNIIPCEENVNNLMIFNKLLDIYYLLRPITN